MTTTNDDIGDLDIPEFLRIPQETRRAAWARVDAKGLTECTRPHATPARAPGDVCRRYGIPDGIDQDLVEHVEMLAAAKVANSKASLYAMDEQRAALAAPRKLRLEQRAARKLRLEASQQSAGNGERK